jgi:hypothetical protein
MSAARTTKMINDGAADTWQRRARTAGRLPLGPGSPPVFREDSRSWSGEGGDPGVSRPAILTQGWITRSVLSGDLLTCPLGAGPVKWAGFRC